MELPLTTSDVEITDFETPTLPMWEGIPIAVEVVVEGEEEDTSDLDADVVASMALAAAPFDANIAEFLSEEDLLRIGTDIHDLIEVDLDSRAEWEATIAQGMRLLGVTIDDVDSPWDGACASYSPLLLESVLRFQAEVMQETCPAGGPAKANTEGEESPEVLKAAHRVTKTINSFATRRIPEYADEHEKMLFTLGLTGYGAKKFWLDSDRKRLKCRSIPPWDMIIPDCSGTLNDYPRFAERLRLDKMQVENNLGSLYLDIPIEELDETDEETSIAEDKRKQLLGLSLPRRTDTRADYTFFESHVYWSIDIDPITEGKPAPYVVTIQAGTYKVLSIYRDWLEHDVYRERTSVCVDYRYNPGMGGHGLGLLHMLGSSAETATAGTRQLIDAGTLSVLPGGFKDSNLRIKGDNTPHIPGEWRDVDISAGKLSESFFGFPYKEPSAVMAALVERVTSEARSLVGLNELRPADMSTQAPVGTTLALLERALKPLSAIQARIHRYMRHELALLRDLILDSYEQLAEREPLEATIEELMQFHLVPVSDSNASTLTQRIAQYQMVIQMAEKVPEKFDLEKLAYYGLNMIDFPGTEEVLKLTEQAKPLDAITENGRIIQGEGVKAFMHQDHEAHIRAHQALRDDPVMQELAGQSPKASLIMAAWDAHMREHVAMGYIAQAQSMLGAALPANGDTVAEKELAPFLAEVSQKILQQHQAIKAQQAAQQAAQDPVLQDQQQKTIIEQGKLLLEAKKHDDNTRIKIMDIVSRLDKQDASEIMFWVEKIISGANATNTPASSESLPTGVQKR